MLRILPFRQGLQGASLSAGRILIAFQAKVSRWIENFDRDGYFCIRECFWLEKPDFHNRRIHSAAWIVVGNLPERQHFYLPRRHKDAKSASSLEVHNPCTAWRQHLSPYLKGTVNGNWELGRSREMGKDDTGRVISAGSMKRRGNGRINKKSNLKREGVNNRK